MAYSEAPAVSGQDAAPQPELPWLTGGDPGAAEPLAAEGEEFAQIYGTFS